jgi:hypothetical protein
LKIKGIAAAACRCQYYGDLKTHLKGKKLDLAQLGKAIVDAATNSPKSKKKKRVAERVTKPFKNARKSNSG